MNQKRVHLIDGMRGLSLFGILLANLLIFQYGMWGKEELHLSGINEGAFHFTKVFIEGSFMPIFTFLFGYSMVKMAEGLRQRDLKVKRYFARRFLLLAVIGWAHGTFLWEGDILFFYGLMGFFLLLFVNRKSKTILVWAILLTVLTTSFMLIGAGFSGEGTSEEEFMTSAEYIDKTNDVYANGTYSEIKHHRNTADPFEEMPEALVLVMVVLAPIATAPLFLFGMYAARINMFANPVQEEKRYRIGTIILVPIGIAMKAIFEFGPSNGWTDFLIGAGAPLLAVGYIFAFAWLYTKCTESVAMRAFESVGKLSLTNYMMQTVICTTVFYGYGLGLFGKLGTAGGLLLGLSVFALQCAASYFYLKRFRRGPLEFILRVWTNFSWNGQVKPKKAKKKREAEAHAL
ncbi:DUF418 domain-containing protein [Sporosarcina sp. Te-1]|uniref:DUF418 domain-containing protein n=1 Tax=Sporosarcina sp. Te-1 TaxID=2818390 RepID=UPI001A9CC98B|nr:DUF418 domain-containing protein [Sporosarcina sp. Te-1]QTD39982.1 DUF418 domain-containing protein [Sporosarcina sp. Te-1]